MKRRFQHPLAAALLLLPVAPLVLSTPAAAQQRQSGVEIQALSVNADHGVAPGSTLRLTVRGSPDASAVQVRMGSGSITIPLREVAPGHYTADHVVRRSDRIDPTDVMTARLQKGERSASRKFSFPASFQALAQGAAPQPSPWQPEELARMDRGDRRDRMVPERERTADRDDRPPQINDLSPGNGERVGERGRVHISASIADEGSGLDLSAVRMRINGEDVSHGLRVTPDAVHLRDNLPPGRHTVEVRVADHARNTTTKTWSFDVVARD